jgi:hypothetical protein
VSIEVRHRLEQNLRILSRTLSTRIVSTASTPGKAELLIAAESSADDIRRTTEANLAASLDLVEELLAKRNVPLDLRAASEQVNTIFARGILKSSSPYRSRDPASEFPYIPAVAVPEYAAFFYRAAGSSPASAEEIAAWAVWAIDLRGHIFADGCGKTATVVSGLILARADRPVPLYPARDIYYATPYSRSGAMSW